MTNDSLTPKTGNSSSAIALWVPAIIVGSVFGPYIVPGFGLRTEQVVVYSAVPIVFAALSARRLVMSRAVGLATVVWYMFIALALIGSILHQDRTASANALLAGADSLTSVVLAAVVVSYCAAYTPDPKPVVQSVFLVTCVGLGLSGLAAVAGLFTDLEWLLSRWWSAGSQDGILTSVAQRAAAGGRHGGIFNQPIEAGIGYTLGLLCWAGLDLRRPRHWKLFLAIPITVGGLLSGSKFFWLVGIPVSGVSYVLVATRAGVHRRVSPGSSPGARAFLTLLAAVVGLIVLVPRLPWSGSDLPARFMSSLSDQDPLYVVTGGRFGQTKAAVTDFGATIESAALYTGFGLAPGLGPLDNGYIAAISIAGILGGVLYVIAVLSPLASFNYESRCAHKRGEGTILVALAVVAVVGSVGGPILFLNRVGVLWWALVSVLSTAAAVHAQRSRG